MIAYCENKMDCRRHLVLSYFGEKFDKAECKQTCDNCLANLSADFKDISSVVRDLLSIVQQMGDQQATVTRCIDTYRGLKNAKVMEFNFNNFDEYGKGIYTFVAHRTLTCFSV